jgi:predicted Zn-dependent protease
VQAAAQRGRRHRSGQGPDQHAVGDDVRQVTATPAQRARRVRDFVDAAGGLETAGYCRTLSVAAGFVNSAGHHATSAFTEAAMDGIARAEGSDGVARTASVRLADLDGADLGATAAAKARAGTEAVELPAGRYGVVPEPQAAADLLINLALTASTAVSSTTARASYV